MRQHVFQRRIVLEGNGEAWITRIQRALDANGFEQVDIDAGHLRARFHERRTAGTITVKIEDAATHCVLHVTTLAARPRQNEIIFERFAEVLRRPTG